MSLIALLFWISLFIIFYSYIGYGILVYCLVQAKKLFLPEQAPPPAYQPAVALVISAYNEEDFIEVKINNTLELEYPPGKLTRIIITDGSTDRTPEIISRYPAFRLLHQPERKGKSAAMNRAVQQVAEPVVIFSDANTLLNKTCIQEITRHYADPRVGGVAGEKKIMAPGEVKAASAGESLYWKYESFLKKLDSDFYTVVGAAGELFSVRTALYESLQEGTIIEDFVASLRICEKGYVVRYEPKACSLETASETMKEEQKRKVRICAGAFQAMGMLKQLFNIFRYPAVSFQFISHRVLRWTLCPVCLILVFVANLLLVLFRAQDFYGYLFVLQVVFYLLATTGWLFANRNIKVKALYIPYYFLFMNMSVFIGFSRYLRKEQSVLWEKATRGKFS